MKPEISKPSKWNNDRKSHDIRYIKKEDEVNATNYIQGIKVDPEKKLKVENDNIQRLKLKLVNFYQSEFGLESF